MAKRVNTRFLVWVTGIVLVVFGVLYGVPHLRAHLRGGNNARAEMQVAQTLFNQGHRDEAKDHINIAFQLDRTDKEICLLRGDIYASLTEQDGYQSMDTARACWQVALDIDPTYKPALQRLLDSYVDMVDISLTAQTLARLHDTAAAMVKLDPSNVRAQAYLQIAVLEQWMIGASMTDQEIQKSIDALAALHKKDPSSSETLYYLTLARAQQAQVLKGTGKPDVAEQRLAQSRADLAASTAAFPNASQLNMRAYVGYRKISQLEADPDLAKKDREAADAAIGRAVASAKESDPRYADVQFYAAEWAAQNNHPAEVEKILRGLYQSHNDQRARLKLAEALRRDDDPAKRAEAIHLLQGPVVATGERVARLMGVRMLEIGRLIELAYLRIDDARAATDPAKKAAALADVDEDFKKIGVISRADDVRVLRLAGTIAQVKHQPVDAVKAYSTAVTLMEHNGHSSSDYYETLYQLALADRDAGQNHAAEKLLVKVVNQYNGFVPAHIVLAQLLLQDRDTVNAESQVAQLAQLDPKNPDVLRLQMALKQMQNKTGDSRELYDQLPENTFEARLVKAQAAANLNDMPETVRLLKGLHEERPADPALSAALAQAYYKSQRPIDARKALAAGLQANPNNPRLLILQKLMENASQEEVAQYMRELDLANAGDPCSREVQQGRFDLSDRKYDSALAHARAADQIRANDPHVWDLYFQIYRTQRNWDLAQKAVDNLSRLNADKANGRIYAWTLAMSKGDYATAITIGRQLVQADDSFGRTWLLLARACQANGQFREAISNYQYALERQTTDVQAYRGLFDCYTAIGQPEVGRQKLEQGRRMFPDNVELRELALSYDMTVNPAAVIPVREKILKDDPNTQENYTRLASTCIMAAQKIYARDPAQAKKYTDQARDVLTQAVARFPDSPDLNGALAESLQDGGRFEQGKEVIEQFIARPKSSNNPKGYLLLATYYARAHMPQQAEKALRDAWAITKNTDVTIEQRLAAYLASQTKFDEALNVLKTNAQDPLVVRLTLETQIAARHTALAERGINEALDRTPNNTELMNLLTGVYIDGHRLPEARTEAAKVLKLDPSNDVALYYQALIELRDPAGGDMGIARNNLSTIVGRNPRNVVYKMAYADTLQGMHDGADAAIQLEDIVRLDPLNREARGKLLDIYSTLGNWTSFETAVRDAELNDKLNSDPLWYKVHAYALVSQGQFKAAVDKIRTAITLAKTDTESAGYVRDYMSILIQSRDYDEVIRETDKLLDNGHHEWWVYQSRGLARSAAGKKDEALEQFDKSLAAATQAHDDDGFQSGIVAVASDISIDEAISRLASRVNTQNRWRLLDVTLRMRKPEMGVALAELGPLLNGANVPVADRLRADHYAAECCQFTGQYEDARKYYLAWLRESPNDAHALNNVAYLLAENLKKPDEARQYSQHALDLAQRRGYIDPMIQDTHGWVLTLCKGVYAQQGLDLLTRVVQEHADFLEARYHLARALLMQNRPTDAIAQLTTALDQIKSLEAKKQPVRPELKQGIEGALAQARTLTAAR